MNEAEADTLLGQAILDPVIRQDPTQVYRQLHEHLSHWKSNSGMTVVAGYRDGMEMLRNPKWGRPEPDMELNTLLANRERRGLNEDSRAMLFLNPPDHTRIRSLVARAFTPRRVEALRPAIQELLEPIMSEFAASDASEVMSTLAIPFPVAVISELLGVPIDPTGNFQKWVRDSTAFIDVAATEADLDAATAAIENIGAFFIDLIGYKRDHPDDGMLSALIEVEESGDRLSELELLANTMLMYAAGFETTSNLIGNGLFALARNQDEMTKLRNDPSLLPSAIWEILRFDSPVQLNARTALTDDVLFGEPVNRGEQVIVLQGAANHDPSVFEEPESFRVDRFVDEHVAQPLSFGWGAHHCLGAHLARAEGEIVFGELMTRFSAIELSGDKPSYRPSFTLRGLDQLTVSMTPS